MSTRHTRRSRGWLRLCTALVVGGVLATLLVPSAYAATPSNDEIVNAVVVPGVPFSDTRDTSEAIFADGDSGCGAATVWYSFTPDTDGSYRFDTFGSDYDTRLAVLYGSPGNLFLLTCDGGGLQSEIVVPLTAGTTYYIEAGTCSEIVPGACGESRIGRVGPGGTLVFNVDLVPTPPPFDLQLTVSPRGTIGPEPGTATVSYTVTCNYDADNIGFTGSLRQKPVAEGIIDQATDNCTSTPKTWTATVVDAGGHAFRPGTATLTVVAYGCDQFTCDEVMDKRTIKLR
jgi:hypothetical protein